MKGISNAVSAPLERPRSISEVRLRNTFFLRLFLMTVPLHLTPLLWRKRALFEQNVVAQPGLTQIMHQRCQRKLMRALFVPAQAACQPLGIASHTLAMLIGQHITFLNTLGQIMKHVIDFTLADRHDHF